MSVQSEPREKAGRTGTALPEALRFVHGTEGSEAETSGLLASAGGRLSFHNGSARGMLGPAVEVADPLLWVDGLRSEHRGTVLTALEAATSADHRDSMTVAVDRPDGSTTWLRIETMPSFDADGAHVGYAVRLLDTTAEHTAREEIQDAQERAWLMANYDALTGLPNHSHFIDRLDQAIARTRHWGPPAAALLCDVDHFRHVNDRYGHGTGDALLVEIGDRLTANVRDTDTVCRVGGDQFAVLCEAFDDLETLEALGRRLIEVVNRPVRLADTDASSTVGICIGIASATATSTADEVLAAAEAAVHQAKRNGRNGYVTSGSRFALFGTSFRDPHADRTVRRPPRCPSPWQ